MVLRRVSVGYRSQSRVRCLRIGMAAEKGNAMKYRLLIGCSELTAPISTAALCSLSRLHRCYWFQQQPPSSGQHNLLGWSVSSWNLLLQFANVDVVRQPKAQRVRGHAHAQSVRIPKRQFAVQDNATEHVDVGSLAEASVSSSVSISITFQRPTCIYTGNRDPAINGGARTADHFDEEGEAGSET